MLQPPSPHISISRIHRLEFGIKGKAKVIFENDLNIGVIGSEV
jgi:hypothetical protein